MTFRKISVIGAGVMGEAMISALIKAGHQPEHIEIIEKRAERSAELVGKYAVKVGTDLSSSDAVLLLVKPQDLEATLAGINGKLSANALIISFVAGKKIKSISDGLGGQNPIVRVMPNTPTLVEKGAAGYSYGTGVDEHQKRFVIDLLKGAGVAVEVSEELQDAVTATSGSGPAYFFAFVEAMIKGGRDLGLSEEVATELTVQTIIGAAKLLETSGKSPATLRENVTSPNGTTFAALQSFAASDLNDVVAKAMKAARDRSIELS
ncbi:MAG: pyrroline-5-carboxylate reductase [Candidatus Nanopelagicaceae bacterium]